ncbi:small subunit ribosomal protein S1 [Atopostipes suicloacalis DSM 15692]|uniref:Small subunit ribosomal protein S1 n=2 Tax=Atopostipes suicloacalis TaxID=180295 RepID=A0A1M4TCG4_9LACT|nr:30S ribosomal protein S1 [Atopostipes suicloacalis]SHE42133.1 small subunit ribosomal protein S1 [Atopostipes suicloacalis DSM 15692]
MSEKENKDLEVNGEVEETMDDTVETEETEETVEDTPEEVVEDTTEETEETSEDMPDEDNDMESMSEALDASVEIKPGDIVEGVVLAFDEDKNVIVGLDTGHEGYIPIRELSTSRVEDPSEEVEVNDKIRVTVLRVVSDKEQGSYILSKKRVDQREVWNELQEKFDNGETVEAEVNRVVKGGVTVDLGVRGFVPASQLDTRFVRDLSQFEGNTYEFKIIEIDPQNRQLILSRRELLESEEEDKRAQALENLEEGSTVTGTVVRLTNFGAFVDLGGIDGLVHISEIAHEHIDHPEDKLSVGDEIEVKVLSVDKERERVSLSIKDLLLGPWDTVDEEFPAGSVTTGIVKRIVDFGAFVELKPGVEGLVHISEMAHRHVETPHEVVSEDEEVEVKVLNVDQEEQRVSLSIKALEEAPERDEQEQPATQKPKRKEPRQSVRQPSLRDDDDDSAFTIGDQLGDQLKGLFEDDEDEE